MSNLIQEALKHPYQCSHELVGSQSMPFEFEGKTYYTKKMAENTYHVYEMEIKKTFVEQGRGKAKQKIQIEETRWKFSKEVLVH